MGSQEAQLELGRQVAQHPQQAEVREGRRDRHVQQARQPLEQAELGEHRCRLLGADHAHRHDRHPRAHGRLHEAAAAEAAQAIAVLVELLGALASLGEHEHQLLLVVEQPVHVGRVRGHAADLRDQHREARIALEEVLDGDVQRPRVGVLLADRLADHRRVGRQRARVVGHQQGAAVGGHVLDPLHLGAEPVAVEELDSVRSISPSMRSERPQSVSRRSGSMPGQVAAQVVLADRGQRRAGARRRGGAARGGSGACELTRPWRRFWQDRSPRMRGEGPGTPGRLALDGPRGRVALPRRRGAHPQLRGRQGGRRAALPPSGVDRAPRPSRPTPTRPRPMRAGSRWRRARRW